MSAKQAALAAVAAVGLTLSLAAPSLGAVPAAGQLPAPAVGRDDYKIGLYDVLDVKVFENNDLTREVQVDGAGRILLPLVGAVPAAGKTPVQLSDDLRQLLEARYLNHPNVSVAVKQSQSEHVTVDGAVASPGVYPLTGRTTLLQAVAMAKGPDGPNANLHKVTLFRTVDGRWSRTQYDLAKIRHGQAEDPEIEPRDVVVVAGSRKEVILRDLGAILPYALLIPAL